MIRLTLAVVALALLLAGCASTRQAAPDPESTWQERRARLQALDEWQADGRLSVRVERDGGQANFTWIQAGGTYRLRLTGPWGQGGAVLEAGQGAAELDAAEGRHYRGANARSLLASVYGWDIPVGGLRYWLVGLPGEGNEYSLDRFGRLDRLTWNEWEIVYESYRRIQGVELPTDIRVERDAETRVNIAIDEWGVGGDASDDGDGIDSPVPLMGG